VTTATLLSSQVDTAKQAWNLQLKGALDPHSQGADINSLQAEQRGTVEKGQATTQNSVTVTTKGPQQLQKILQQQMRRGPQQRERIRSP